MKNIVIIGSGGMGKEVLWLIENINAVAPTWNVLGFIESDKESDLFGKEILGHKILGGDSWLIDYKQEIYVICGIGKSQIRKKIQDRLSQYKHIKFATLIDPSVAIHYSVKVAEGSIVCKNARLTVDVVIGKGVLINTGASIGHDSIVGDYCSFLTNAMASGHTEFGECCEIGSGAFILQCKKVIANTVVAPLASVLRDISEPGVYSGNPARRMV